MKLMRFKSSVVALAILVCACNSVKPGPAKAQNANRGAAQHELDLIAATYEALVKNVAAPGDRESLSDCFHRFSGHNLSREGWTPHFLSNGRVALADGSEVVLDIRSGSC